MGESTGRNDAVSAVVGIVLLAAIAMVLAGAVFFLAARHSEELPEPAPAFAMATDANAREAEVIVAEPGLDWARDVRLAGTCTPLLNGAAFPTSEGTPVQAGDVLSCSRGELLMVSSSDDKGNALLYRNTFS